MLQDKLQLQIEAQKIMDKRLEDKKIPEPEGRKKPDTSSAAAGRHCLKPSYIEMI